MEVRPVSAEDRAAIRNLLRDSRLPVDDLDSADIALTTAVDAGQVMGVVGLEVFGDTGLLRSLAIQPAVRRNGLGIKLVGVIELQAKAQGLKHLVLLTETAATFFAKCGYRAIPREQFPPEVRQSAQFRSLCPDSAICMIKSLEPAS